MEEEESAAVANLRWLQGGRIRWRIAGRLEPEEKTGHDKVKGRKCKLQCR